MTIQTSNALNTIELDQTNNLVKPKTLREYNKNNNSDNYKASAPRRQSRVSSDTAPSAKWRNNTPSKSRPYDTKIHADDSHIQEDPNISGNQIVDARQLKKMSIHTLLELCEKFSLAIESENPKKHEIISAFLEHVSSLPDVSVIGSGVLEILPDGFGFLRSHRNAYGTEMDDIYVSANQINRFRLRAGDTIKGTVRTPSNNAEANKHNKSSKNEDRRHLALMQVIEINSHRATDSVIRYRNDFEDLVAISPYEKFHLEIPGDKNGNISNRFLDIVAPIGKGQRALIVAPPKTGKTVLMKNIAHGIVANHPEVHLIILLIDERPEEVTDMERSVKAEVASSTFDEHPTRHIQLAEMTLAKAKRLVETGKDVVILLDSITRLARAYNTVVPSSGKVLTGGVEANALQKPKRFFGAARKAENGGSLTIIATALIETGSKMDEVIFEEFKGTGNCDIYLDRSLAQKNEFPAVDIPKSGTRKADLLMDPQSWHINFTLRNIMVRMGDANDFLRGKITQTKTNQDFYASANKVN